MSLLDWLLLLLGSVSLHVFCSLVFVSAFNISGNELLAMYYDCCITKIFKKFKDGNWGGKIVEYGSLTHS